MMFVNLFFLFFSGSIRLGQFMIFPREARADELFGTVKELLRQEIDDLDLSPEGRVRPRKGFRWMKGLLNSFGGCGFWSRC